MAASIPPTAKAIIPALTTPHEGRTSPSMPLLAVPSSGPAFAAGARALIQPGGGNYVIVRTADGHDLIYAHLASVAAVQGMTIAAGERLGIQGSTGNSTGPHLHFEVRKGVWQDKQDIDPVAYLQGARSGAGHQD